MILLFSLKYSKKKSHHITIEYEKKFNLIVKIVSNKKSKTKKNHIIIIANSVNSAPSFIQKNMIKSNG